jgi:cobalt-zinc-cadmium resistance protein CzcA
MREIILKGTTDRLRPVLLTAGAAATGFLPMAISTGSGAEVQRPLATVVIGGLFTSTLLTMIALPLLFEIFNNGKKYRFRNIIKRGSKVTLFLLIACLPSLSLQAQQQEISLDDAIGIALKNNSEMASYALRIEESKLLKTTAYAVDKTYLNYGYDQNNIAENGFPLKVLGVQQSFSFPTLYKAELKLKETDIAIAETELEIQKQNLSREVAKCYVEAQTWSLKSEMYERMDSLYKELLSSSELKYKKGETGKLELLNIIAKQQQVNLELGNAKKNLEIMYQKLKTLMATDLLFRIKTEPEMIPYTGSSLENNPEYKMLTIRQKYNENMVEFEKKKFLPDIDLSYFVGTNNKENSKYYHGFQAGFGIPLFFGSQKAKIEASKVYVLSQQKANEYELSIMNMKLNELNNERDKYRGMVDQYNNSSKPLHDEIVRTATAGYHSGEIDFFSFAASLEIAIKMEMDYLDNLLNYNLYTLELVYFSK